MHKVASPPPRAPVILLTEPKAPVIVFFIKLPAPSPIPTIPSKGPYANPSAGFENKSEKPVEILLNNPTGFPIIFKLPNISNTSLKA